MKRSPKPTAEKGLQKNASKKKFPAQVLRVGVGGNVTAAET